MRRHRASGALVSFLLVLGVSCLGAARPLRAQDRAAAIAASCEEGRVRVEGRCCWPSQTWSEPYGRCSGVPACPTDLVEHGEDCVVRAQASVPTTEAPTTGAPAQADAPGPAEQASVPPAYSVSAGYGETVREALATTLAWPSSSARQDAPRHVAVVTRGEDEGLITAALVVFDVGWLLGWLGTVLTEASGCRTFTGFGEVRVACDAWPWAFIPIAGGMSAGIAGINRRSGLAFAFGIPSVILQGVGLIMTIIAFSNETTEIAVQPLRLGRSLSASLTLGAESADAGLTLGLRY